MHPFFFSFFSFLGKTMHAYVVILFYNEILSFVLTHEKMCSQPGQNIIDIRTAQHNKGIDLPSI